MRIIFALLSGLIGLVLIFGGYRLARLIIPLWGFVAGLSLGGAVIAALAGTPFLATVLGLIIGIVLGLLFAIFAYLYFSLAVVILIGSLGYWAGSNFIEILGFHAGFLSTVVGLLLGIVVGIFALLTNAPKYVLILITSIAGAIATVAGILLLFNVVPLSEFSYSAAHVKIDSSLAWSILALVLAIVGVAFQVNSTSDYELNEWSLNNKDLPYKTHTQGPHSHST